MFPLKESTIVKRRMTLKIIRNFFINIIIIFFKLQYVVTVMDAEELLFNQPLVAIDNAKRERIYSVVASGKSKQYLGRQLNIEEAQNLTIEEVEALHDRYTSLLGGKIVKSLGQSIISLYSRTIGHYFPVDKATLHDELMNNPIVSDMLSTVSCSLYYKFGVALGPVAIGLITFNNLIFNNSINNDGTTTCDSGDKTEKSRSSQGGEKAC